MSEETTSGVKRQRSENDFFDFPRGFSPPKLTRSFSMVGDDEGWYPRPVTPHEPLSLDWPSIGHQPDLEACPSRPSSPTPTSNELPPLPTLPTLTSTVPSEIKTALQKPVATRTRIQAGSVPFYVEGRAKPYCIPPGYTCVPTPYFMRLVEKACNMGGVTS